MRSHTPHELAKVELSAPACIPPHWLTALWRFPLSLAPKLIMVIILTRCAPTVNCGREF